MAPVATEGGARARAGCVSPHPACNPLPWLLPVLSLDPSATAKPSHSLSSLCHEPFCGGWPTRLTGGGGVRKKHPCPWIPLPWPSHPPAFLSLRHELPCDSWPTGWKGGCTKEKVAQSFLRLDPLSWVILEH